MDFIELSKGISSDIKEVRAQLHKHPEPSTQEVETAKIILDFLNQLKIQNIKTELGNGGNGIIVDIKGGHPGKKVALRADMDALPIAEETGLDYSSLNEGYMHACGHDTHVAMLLGATKIIYENRESLKGSVRIIFQPAEELSPEGGAKSMIKAGALDEVDAIFGFHVWPELPFGVLGFKSGPLMAASDHFYVDIKGKSTHAASPEKGADALLAGAEYVMSVQQIVSRNVSAVDNAVITIGLANSGTRYNIVAEECKMEGTCRTLKPEIRDLAEKRLEEILDGVCAIHNCTGKLDYKRGYISLINDPKMTGFAKEQAKDLFGQDHVQTIQEAELKAEDFAFYLEKVPGSFIWLGTNQGEYWPLHNSHFAPDDDLLWMGSAMFSKIAFEFTQNT